MPAKPTETLLIVSKRLKLASVLDSQAFHVHPVHDPGKAMEMLRDTAPELILLDEQVFGADVLQAVREIKRRLPLVPVLVISKNRELAFQTSLLEAGADDSLAPETSAEDLQSRLALVMRQRRQAQALARRNQNLRSINTFARRMHSARDPMELIQDTIEQACATFRLYGLVVALIKGGDVQLFSGRDKATLTEEQRMLGEYDPFRRVIEGGIVQVFQNVMLDPHFVSIPSLPQPTSVILLPLSYQDERLGALAVFGTEEQPLTQDDLLVYELFASQFAVALNNAQVSRSQRVAAQSSQHLVSAWQRFVDLNREEETATSLLQFVTDVPNVTDAVVWMTNSDPFQPGTIVTASRPDVGETAQALEAAGHLKILVAYLDVQRMQPFILAEQRQESDSLAPLFEVMHTSQIMVVPIQDSARFIGIILAGIGAGRQYTNQESLLQVTSLGYAAGQALERIILIRDMLQKTARLETLLRSTSQGIFFLDNVGNVAFCNPQLAELTGVKQNEVLGQPPAVLLERIAAQSDDSTQVLAQFEDAVARLLTNDPNHHEDYPIVEITLPRLHRDIDVEFMLIGDQDAPRISWAGLVRDNTRYKRSYGGQRMLLEVMSERIRVPYAQMRGLVNTLSEQQSRFTHRERARFLRQLETSVEQMGHLWDNILEMYQLQAVGLTLSPEESDLYEMVQRILDSRAFAEYRRYIQIEAPSNLPLIELDALRVEQAIANILHNAVRFSPHGAPVYVRLERQGDQILLMVQDQGMGIPTDELNRIGEPFFQASNNSAEEGAGLGLFLAREVVQRHGGSLQVQSAPGAGTVINITLPMRLAAEARGSASLPAPAEADLPRRRTSEVPVAAAHASIERPSNGRRVAERPVQTIMLVQGRSQLAARIRERMNNDYEVIVYSSGEEALRDLSAVRLDLIFVDVHLRDANGLEVAERMCKHTEVPIIVLADEASEPEKVRSYMIGVDDYMSSPISDDELIWRINVISKRRRIQDRMREPMDLGNLYIDFARREVFLNNKPLELTRIEYDLLHTLAINGGQVLTHKQLLEKVWGPEYQAETQYLWVNVSRLRKKLEPSPDSPRFIHTQPGVGYVFRQS